jgi:hypothetical protein
MEPMRYVGLYNDDNFGMTHWGQMVKDAWVFGLIPDTEDCAGWSAGQMQVLYERIWAEWEKYAHLPSRLPEALQQRYLRIHQEAIERAKSKGWDPELGEDD